jgi:ribose 5-phosphate isomerase B
MKKKTSNSTKVFLGCDHAGYETKERVKKILRTLKVDFKDHTEKYDKDDDYPDFAGPVGKAVAKNKNNRGILICGTGIGMSIAANKIKGVRAALCRTEYDSKMTRLHNDANILVLGASAEHSDADLANIVSTFLTEEFEGGRHQRRIDKIKKLENQK